MMPVQDSLEEAEYRAAVDTVAAVIQGYLTEARGEPVEGFTADTPFMDAGLDSLDMLKASHSFPSYLLLEIAPCQGHYPQLCGASMKLIAGKRF